MRPMVGKPSRSRARPSPETRSQADPNEPNGPAAATVTVMADDYGRDPIRGTLVTSTPNEIAIRRNAPEVGEVVVHFPRVGFVAIRG